MKHQLLLPVLSGLVVGSVSGAASAALDPKEPRGESVVQHEVPGRDPEICVIPRQYAGGDYSKDDKKDEAKLCEMSAYSTLAVCPKLNSTNPGTEFFTVPEGITRQELEARKSGCELDPKDTRNNPLKLDNKKLAKYKQSTSCSYTPSIVGYYHMSRILGDVANVPPSVVRTLDIQTHQSLARRALSLITKPDSLIYKTWTGLKSILDQGLRSPNAAKVLTKDGKQSYGALSVNPGGEEFYEAFFTRPETAAEKALSRAELFKRKNPTYRALTRTEPISNFIGREFTAENVQRVVQLRDASEMILLDTLLSQQDRFGNIHYVNKFAYLDPKERDANGLPKTKLKKKLKPEEVQQYGAVEVREMILKDNDCGVAKSNVALEVGLIDGVAHMKPDTYNRLQALATQIQQNRAQVQEYFKTELLFTDKDVAVIFKNIVDVSAKLKANCKAQKLRLDLDLSAHFAGGGAPAPTKCE